MDDKQRLQLHAMIGEHDVIDQTELIRELKHSETLKREINKLVELRSEISDETDLHMAGIEHCAFLFTYYTDIYNKIRKNEIDLDILDSLLLVLKDIEEGKTDQHEGSFRVGTILKELYVDSAIKKCDKLDKINMSREDDNTSSERVIQYSEYKKLVNSAD